MAHCGQLEHLLFRFDHHVRLTWIPPVDDYAGVYIYRKETGRSDVHQLEGGLITDSSYEDYNVQASRHYSYFVFAVDAAGQEAARYDSVEIDTMAASVTRRVSVASDGRQGNGASAWPSISSDGRFVAFSSNASNLVDNDTNEAESVRNYV